MIKDFEWDFPMFCIVLHQSGCVIRHANEGITPQESMLKFSCILSVVSCVAVHMLGALEQIICMCVYLVDHLVPRDCSNKPLQ